MAIAALLSCAATQATAAESWTAVEARGTVFALVGQQWEELSRGDEVAGGQPVRTMRSGRAQLQREQGSISLGPNTALQIDDSADGSFTTVMQYSGVVAIKAAERPQSYLAIETPILVAVTSGSDVLVTLDDETAQVKVESGTVTVVDRLRGYTMVIGAGQAVTSSASKGISVSGNGTLPVIFDATGVEVTLPAAAQAFSSDPETAGSGAGNSNAGGNGNPGGNSGNAGNSGGPGNSGDSGPGNSGNAGNSGNQGQSSEQGNSGNAGSNSNAGGGNSGGKGKGRGSGD